MVYVSEIWEYGKTCLCHYQCGQCAWSHWSAGELSHSRYCAERYTTKVGHGINKCDHTATVNYVTSTNQWCALGCGSPLQTCKCTNTLLSLETVAWSYRRILKSCSRFIRCITQALRICLTCHFCQIIKATQGIRNFVAEISGSQQIPVVWGEMQY